MKHAISLAVRSYECDSNGHVNHAVYVNYLEHARIQGLQAAGCDYAGLLEVGYATVVTRLEIRYRAPAHAGDELALETETVSVRRASGTFRQAIRRADTLIATAEVEWGVVDRHGRPCRPPPGFDLRRLAP
jgi:acyl-CoA thioester hydrolase